MLRKKCIDRSETDGEVCLIVFSILVILEVIIIHTYIINTVSESYLCLLYFLLILLSKYKRQKYGGYDSFYDRSFLSIYLLETVWRKIWFQNQNDHQKIGAWPGPGISDRSLRKNRKLPVCCWLPLSTNILTTTRSTQPMDPATTELLILSDC